MKKIFLVLMLFTLFVSCKSLKSRVKIDYRLKANLVTERGDIEIFLYPEGAPLTVANFINLSDRGYYNGLTFHRVIENFMIQGGDPLGTGKGGPGYTFKDEFVKWLDFYSPGVLAMANSGANTNGSQFFITTKETSHLNQKHTIFGDVVSFGEAMKILKEIKQGDKILKIEISGRKELFMKKYIEQVIEWNKILDEKKVN